MVSLRRRANMLAAAVAAAAERRAARMVEFEERKAQEEELLTKAARRQGRLGLKKLGKIQEKLKKMKHNFDQEVLREEQKFDERRKSVLTRRNKLIQSSPNFWHDIILCHPKLYWMLNEEDEEILRYIECLLVEDFEDGSGYTISFTFKPNRFFEETKLTKTFKISGDGTVRATGTPINWKEEKGPVAHENDGSAGNKTLLSEKSFFSWFGESSLQDPLVKDDEIADIIKQDVWVNALRLLSNETL